MWNVLAPQEGGTLAIFGTGNVGLFAVMAANLLPLDRIIAVDLIDQRLQLAGELGATDTINSSSADVVEALNDIADGRGVDFAIDTTANPKILRAAVDALAITGTCAVVGIPAMGTEVALDVQGQLVGKRLVGVTMGDGEPRTG